MAQTLASTHQSTLPFSSNSPTALSHSRPSSSSSSRRNQAQPPPPPSERSASTLNGWARTREDNSREKDLRSTRGSGEAAEAVTAQGDLANRSQSGSRASVGASSYEQHSSGSSSIPTNPSHYQTALASPSSRRPPSAHSSASSSNCHALSSPRSQQPSYPSSSLTSTTAAEAAFDYDPLLGLRPVPGSNASISPPSSTEDEKQRLASADRLQGLGFMSSPDGTAGKVGIPGVFDEWYAEGEEDQDSWLHLQSTARMASVDLTPPVSSPPSYPGSLPTSGSGNVRQPTTVASGVGSPLSPLVAPFSPSAWTGSLGRASGSPWIAAGSGGIGQQTTREREPSWNASLTALSPTPSYTSSFPRGPHSRESTYPNASQQGAYSSIPPGHRFSGEILSPNAYHAAPHPPFEESSSPFPPSGPFAPPVSQPMSQVGSRESALLPPSRKERDSLIDKGGYVRSGFPDRGGYQPSGGAPASNTPFAPSLSATNSVTGPSGILPIYETSSGAESLTGTDEVSTIFVVGFPEDMQEREFQNMFLFAEGFEGATLKIPAATAAQREWEKEMGAAVVATSSSAGGSDGGHGASSGSGGYDDYPAAEQQQQPASALPPHLLASVGGGRDLLAAVRDGAGSPLGGGSSGGASTPASVSGKKQIIGFARFRTRQQAMDAKEGLTGKRVDAEKGSVLKAEMAKKNLHVRKNPPSVVGVATGFEQPPPGPITPTTSQLPLSSPASTTTTAPSVSTAVAPGSGPSIPLSALDPNTLAKIANVQHMNPAVLAEIARQSMAAAAANRTISVPPEAPPADLGSRSAFDAFHSVPPQGSLNRREMTAQGGDEPAYYRSEPVPPFISGNTPLSPSMSDSSLSPPHHSSHISPYGSVHAGTGGPPPPPQHHSHQSLSYLHQHQPQQSEDVSRPSLQSFQQAGGYGSSDPLRDPRDRQQVFPSLGAGAAGGGGGGAASAGSYGPYGSPLPGGPTPRQQALVPGLGSPPLSYAPGLGVIPRTQNPADMNAPKNTLYVGGLPAVLPSLTGPFSASHLEDSLRNAFSRCPGFKRLQFRSKSNGPIVFVEFVDTGHATRAMQELYGHTLGGLVKGGIRLSYSKNPLGVRSNGMPSGNPPSLVAPLDAPLHGGYVSPTSFGGPASNSPFGNMPYDPHRRHPDPVYGETAYPSAPVGHHPGVTSLTPPVAGLGRSPNLISPTLANFGHAHGSGSASASTPSHYGGAFSPFGLDG
ncbi:hypothetical protein JCM11641_001185 [Rhodosporidiobolus odoratus]